MCESHEPRRVGMLERDLIACIRTQDLEAGVAAWDRHGPPPSCRAVSSFRHLVWLTILGSSIPYQMLPCLPAGCGPKRDHAQRYWPVVTLTASAHVWEGNRALVGSLS